MSELSAREAIRELVAGYAQLVDAGRIDDLVELFAPDATMEVYRGPAAIGRDDIREFFGGVGESLAATKVPKIRHHTSNLRITVEDTENAHGSCYFLCVTDIGPDHWGRYEDRYRPVDGEWRFAHRTARTDGWMAGGWAAARRAGGHDVGE